MTLVTSGAALLGGAPCTAADIAAGRHVEAYIPVLHDFCIQASGKKSVRGDLATAAAFKCGCTFWTVRLRLHRLEVSVLLQGS